ncbi:radical SAM protein [Clostridium perfringens]|uniref:radical SAM protein n=1 Tax=Clostridium perfringens TaxID=1502 RepID=UPI001159473A|nr:radical SAM protein [Clostridium perfringens]ELP5177968.1 radical SAM protein [Clostridium perfringens]ELP5181466.1 radical SAM protein [Clostridium perfringens]MDM0666458.1 radical SAM protein [Clostridium perfringens]MDM0675338.1 radical SAM protein [Clostridium perfringens]MDM0906766.1 radical SAM protein [Clostridium perfringens]
MKNFCDYNLVVNNDDNFLVYNIFNSKFLKLENSYFYDMKQFIESDYKELSSTLKEVLEKEKLLLNSDEIDRLKCNFEENKVFNLIILPTEKCNFRCVYCYESYEAGTITEETVDNMINIVKQKINEIKVLSVQWFGGEPLLEIDKIEGISDKLITLCNEHNVIYTASMTTNGYFLTLENFKRLKKKRVYSYQITLDGLGKTHNKQRCTVNKQDTFDTIYNNLLSIKNNIKSFTWKIIIRTNLSSEIYENIDEYIDFLYDNFGEDKRFDFLWRVASDLGNMTDVTFKEKFISQEEYLDVLEKACKKQLLSQIHLSFFRYKGFECYASNEKSLVIGSKGVVHKCTCDLENDCNKLFNVNQYKGLYYENDKFKIWTKDNEVASKCKNCSYKVLCNGRSCRLADIKTNKPGCPMDIQYLKDIFKSFSQNKKMCSIYR